MGMTTAEGERGGDGWGAGDDGRERPQHPTVRALGGDAGVSEWAPEGPGPASAAPASNICSAFVAEGRAPGVS